MTHLLEDGLCGQTQHKGKSIVMIQTMSGMARIAGIRVEITLSSPGIPVQK
jgi:hypothetical protein